MFSSSLHVLDSKSKLNLVYAEYTFFGCFFSQVFLLEIVGKVLLLQCMAHSKLIAVLLEMGDKKSVFQ